MSQQESRLVFKVQLGTITQDVRPRVVVRAAFNTRWVCDRTEKTHTVLQSPAQTWRPEGTSWRCDRTKKTGTVPQSAVTFRDVAGVDSALEELREVVACLRDASAYSRLGARMPAGVLLSGPPGTGKTLLGTRPSLPRVRLLHFAPYSGACMPAPRLES